MFPVLFDIRKSKKITACVVKHSVQNNPYPLPVAFGHIVCQIFVCTKTAVQLFVIRRFISVPHRFKKRANVNRVAAKFLYMGYPRQQFIQPGSPYAFSFGAPASPSG